MSTYQAVARAIREGVLVKQPSDRIATTTTRPRTAEARKRAIVECVAAGQSLRSVAAAFGVSPSQVWKIARRAGVHSRCPSSIPSWPAERIEALRRLRAEGLSLDAITRRLGVKSKGTVFNYAKRHGITPPLPAVTKDYAARNRAIVERVGSGVSHAQAAAEFGVSRGRISQIVLRAREVRPQTAAAVA